MSNDKIKRLQIYVDKMKYAIQISQGSKREFFERELRKTNAKIQELTK